MRISSFRELIVWQKGVDLVEAIYIILHQLPRVEEFGLVSQMRRAAVSIPTNIAEGRHRRTRKDFLRFLSIAKASAVELETEVAIVERVYPEVGLSIVKGLLDKVQRMLGTMIIKLESSVDAPAEKLQASSSQL